MGFKAQTVCPHDVRFFRAQDFGALLVEPAAESFKLVGDFLPRKVTSSVASRAHVQQAEFAFGGRESSRNGLVRRASVLHYERGKFAQQVGGDFRIVLCEGKSSFVGFFQVKVHQLFGHRFARADAFVEQKPVFYFRYGRAFDGGGMRDNRIQIEFVIIKLLPDAERKIFVYRVKKGVHFPTALRIKPAAVDFIFKRLKQSDIISFQLSYDIQRLFVAVYVGENVS